MTDLTPEIPIPAPLWKKMVARFNLSPQQKRIVELVLLNSCDKQIAATMGLKVPTVRTYLERIFHRVGVNDRLALVLRLMAECLRDHPDSSRPLER